MKKSSSLILSLAFAGVLASCGDKNSDPQPSNQTVSERLMAKNWMITAATEKEGNKTAVDIYTSQAACLKDNLYKFQASNAFVVDEGNTKCNNASPQTLTGNWALSNNDQILSGTFAPIPGFEIELTGMIEELNATQLILVDTETDNGVTTVTRTTFTAQ